MKKPSSVSEVPTAIPLTGRKVLFFLVVFFVVVAIVNGIMIRLALDTDTGVVSKHPYEEGLAYNKVVEAVNAQEKLGWKVTLQDVPSATPLTQEVEISVQDATGKAIIPDTITANLTRPTREGEDFSVTLAATGKTSIHFPEQGVWDMRIFIIHQKNHYQLSKRLVIKP
jgi:nitrogen fixation protein FixH